MTLAAHNIQISIQFKCAVSAVVVVQEVYHWIRFIGSVNVLFMLKKDLKMTLCQFPKINEPGYGCIGLSVETGIACNFLIRYVMKPRLQKMARKSRSAH